MRICLTISGLTAPLGVACRRQPEPLRPRRRGFCSFSKRSSLQSVIILSDSGNSLRNLAPEAIRKRFAESVHGRDLIRNRVGLHYSRFWPKLKTPSFANQLLSRLKNLKIRVFDRESAKTG